MTSPQFDSNTWYSLQNTGTQFFLGCNSISICGADTSDRTNFEWFQVNKAGDASPYYIRPKSRVADDSGQPFCININTGQPSLTVCNNVSAIWGTDYWNGHDASNGLYFFDTQQGDSKRLHLADGGTWSLTDYNGASASDLDHMRWNVASLGAINDQSYSTVPTVIADSTPSTVVVTSTPSTGSAASSLSGTSSTVVVTVTSSRLTSSSGTSVPNSITQATSTGTTNQASTVTTTASTSRGSTSTSASPVTSATAGSGAKKHIPATCLLAAVPMVLMALQLSP